MTKEMVDNRILSEDAMSAVPGFKPITFHSKFNNIYGTINQQKVLIKILDHYLNFT